MQHKMHPIPEDAITATAVMRAVTVAMAKVAVLATRPERRGDQKVVLKVAIPAEDAAGVVARVVNAKTQTNASGLTQTEKP
jgi:hypothetical protein